MFTWKWKFVFVAFSLPAIKEVNDWAQEMSAFTTSVFHSAQNMNVLMTQELWWIGYLKLDFRVLPGISKKMSLFLKCFWAIQTRIFINFCQSFRKYAKYQKILKWGKKQDWELCRTCIYIPKGRARTSFREA